jgi:pyruvate dehydrogenase E2 component (dihydrolipoamide acetyltransferase)
MTTEFRLPELGENIDSGVVVKVLVSVGDTIARDQSALELETDKAVIEVPSPVGGRVKEIHVKAGDKATVGQLIFTVEADGEKPAPQKIEAIKEVVKDVAPKEPDEKKGPRVEPRAAPPAVAAKAEPPVVAPKPPPREGRPRSTPEFTVIPLVPRTEPQPEIRREAALAAPSVRRLARELGVDINEVSGSGPAGQITMEDVKDHVRQIMTGPRGVRHAGGAILAPVPEFTRWGEVQRKAMSNVRRKTAERMSEAWTTIPHVTQYDKADITALEELRQRFAKKAEAAGGKLTVTAILLKVVASALKVFPQFNASLDMAREEIVYKTYCHIGVAVDTDRGLLVPVVRDVDKKNILELAAELTEAAEKARNKKLALDEMQGGAFTITNLGGIGGTYFSPIVNAPEVAILGVSRAGIEPVFVNGQFEPRLMLPLSLSYDHRLIDGADAARFLRWVAEALEQPFLLALEG